MKTYEVKVLMSAGYVYDIRANTKEEAEEIAIEKAIDEYGEKGVDYPEFEVVKDFYQGKGEVVKGVVEIDKNIF